MLALYVLLFSTLTIRQHQSFNTNALDLAKFDQSIWNTSRARPYQITIGEDLVIESHFSPALALFAPLYWLWPDVRILFVAQSLLLGGAGFLIYWHFRRTAPWLGLIVFAAYLMHPALHQVNLAEFRRITLAVFAISFAVYHLLRRQYGWMALGMAIALLSKEDVSLLVFSLGLVIFLVQKDRRVGVVTMLAGLAWFLLVPFFILPQLMTHDQVAGYQHAASSYGYLGATLPEIVQTLRTNPLIMVEYIGRPERLRALLNLLWPTAFLFLLSPGIALILVPYLGLLLASTSNTMGRLGAWYPSLLVVILYWAAGLGIKRLSPEWQRRALALLLVAGAAGWFANSRLWPGQQFDLARYQISEHEVQVAQILAGIPEEAIVMAQDPLAPHLSHRREIYVLPWVRGGNQPDYVLFDRQMRTYPVDIEAYRTLFNDYLAGPDYAIAQQVDSFYLFEYLGQAAPQQEADIVWPGAMRLQGLSTAAAPPGEAFSSAAEALPAGSTLRVELYWQVLQEMDQNYTVFVHALTEDGRLLAQHDGWPADAHRPTAVLPAGEQFRDVHYLELNEAANLSDLTLRIGLYETAGGAALPSAAGGAFAELPAR